MDSIISGHLRGRTTAAGEIGIVRIRVPKGADDIAGMLFRNLFPKCLIVLPGGGDGVPKLFHQGRVIPQDILGQIVA